MGNLPKERVRENFPFDCSGIDFIGPFWIKSNKQRKKEEDSLIFSDNGKTFIGANAELKRLYKLVINPDPELAGFLVDENINWKFLPPRAPNFGGL
ncbi:integrase_H2C2 domain-containing protein [Trichonephila clavipes]|uniref:Integrase_H2C2 domain-containing protein n=1 Tax=Trichonephila clavipes TaxID=2585209 RepID=A0A8X6RF96_TRICX|nr:integrase_H2C2 domain-containing protein [Trichonephila clavipes]